MTKDLLAGLKNRSPASTDKSMTPPKGSVNTDTTRSGVAPNQRTLGPRTA